MLGTAILRLVDFCARRSLWVLFAAAILTGSCAVYTVKHFAVNTDTTALFPPNLPWAQRAFQYMRAFPEPGIVVVVEASTPENVEQAASQLAAALAKR
jgi:predicted RND superfamily exporter protein